MAAGLIPSILTAQQAAGSYQLDGGRYAVYNLAGSVRVSAASGQQLTIGVKTEGADAGTLRVATGRIGDHATLRVIYPGDRIVFPGVERDNQTNLTVRDDGTFSDGVGRGRRVTIAGSGSGTRASANLDIGVPAGSAVGIYLAAGEVTIRNVKGDLELDVGLASVDVDGLSGSFSLDAGSGPTRLARLQGGAVSLDVGSGDVTATDVTATQLSLDAGSGTVTLDGLAVPDLSLDTGSGDITLTLTSDIHRLSLDSGSGDVTIYAPATLGARVSAEFGSGDIDVRLPMTRTVRDEDEGELHGVIGDGRGEITIDSGSGDVRLMPR
jgi:hypothetical protein